LIFADSRKGRRFSSVDCEPTIWRLILSIGVAETWVGKAECLTFTSGETMAQIIGSVTVTPINPRPGQSVKIEVRGPNGTMLSAAATATIDGVPGAVAFLQFPTAGVRRLVVTATMQTDRMRPQKVTETAEALVDVRGNAVVFRRDPARFALAQIAMLRMTQSPLRPYEVTFALGAPLRLTDSKFRMLQRPPSRMVPQTRQARDAFFSAPDAHGLTQAILTAMDRSKSMLHASVVPIGTRKSQFFSATTKLTDAEVSSGSRHPAGGAIPRYEWDFGDGQTAVTSGPTAVHDYFPSLDSDASLAQLEVRCRIVHDSVEVRRTLTLHSAYALCKKRRGIISLPIESEVFASKSAFAFRDGGRFQAGATIFNLEKVPVTITHQALSEATSGPANPETPSRPIQLASPFVIPPRSAAIIGAFVPMVLAPDDRGIRFDAPGFVVSYGGQSADGTQVRFSAHFEVPLAERALRPALTTSIPGGLWPWQTMTGVVQTALARANARSTGQSVHLDQGTGTIAVILPADSADKRHVFVDQVRKQARQIHGAIRTGLAATVPTVETPVSPGRQPQPSPVQPLGTAVRQHGLLASAAIPPPRPGAVAVGEICDPDNLDTGTRIAAASQQLVCQATGELTEVVQPPRFVNARRGDIILSPGGPGLIASILRNVTPPQSHSHSGIMTRNYDEITHSTASEERVAANRLGLGGSHLDPGRLKFMWPGVVRQTVQSSIEGELWPDPEDGKQYLISSFSPHNIGSTHNGSFEVAVPLVIKPDPLKETTAIRAKLHKIADKAAAAAGRPNTLSKYHYRLFCFTDPSIGLDTPAGPEAGWAANTLPSVCSSFIWSLLKSENVHLEADTPEVFPGDLEPSDVEGGAMVTPGTRDGLYAYTAEERAHAALWLYNKIHHEVVDEAGWLGNALTGAAKAIGSQLCNSFVNDNPSPPDPMHPDIADAWKRPGTGKAVSPDNILFWDAPDANGLYGYAEPLQYREARAESYIVSRWKQVLTHGAVSGVVRSDANLVSGALVQLYDGKETFTGADGRFTLIDVPLGDYVLSGQKVSLDGTLLSGRQAVTVASQSVIADLQLAPPSDRYRLLEIFVEFNGVDDETLASNESHHPGPETDEIELGPDKLTNSTNFTYKWGGEVRAEFDLKATLQPDGSIQVLVDGRLYEGTSENTDDLDGSGYMQLSATKDSTAAGILRVNNTDENAPDYGQLAVAIRNKPNHA
jgi:hypothetical protein